MAALNWSETLALQQPRMDDTHREFVELLGELEAAAALPKPELLAQLDRFVAHTEAHFGQEDAWMMSIGFQPTNCHAREHREVLELLHEVQRRVREQGQLDLVVQLVPALAQWFVPHAQNMDGGLAQVIVATGFDPETGHMLNPPDAPGDEAFQPQAEATVEVGAEAPGCCSSPETH